MCVVSVRPFKFLHGVRTDAATVNTDHEICLGSPVEVALRYWINTGV